MIAKVRRRAISAAGDMEKRPLKRRGGLEGRNIRRRYCRGRTEAVGHGATGLARLMSSKAGGGGKETPACSSLERQGTQPGGGGAGGSAASHCTQELYRGRFTEGMPVGDPSRKDALRSLRRRSQPPRLEGATGLGRPGFPSRLRPARVWGGPRRQAAGLAVWG